MLMNADKRIAIAILLLFIALGALLPAQTDKRDPKAEEVAAAMMKAMGGEHAWKAAHFIRYDFKVTRGGKQVVNRSHLWDKWGGRYRLETKTKDGKSEVVLFTNVNDKQGGVYRDGAKLEGADADKALQSAHGAYINDMYWLAMPWKWMDPGVNVKYVGPQKRGKDEYEVVQLTFSQVGLTPGDTYRAFISKASNLMTYWEYTLQNKNKGAWDWQYTDTGGIKLASNHTNAQKDSINMGDVRVLQKVDDAFFIDPKRTLEQLR